MKWSLPAFLLLLSFCLITAKVVFLRDLFWQGNKWPRLFRLNLMLNICIDNSGSRMASNSSNCNLLFSGWNGINLNWNSHLSSLFFDRNDLILSLFIFHYSWWYKIQKSRETHKVVPERQFTLYFTKLFYAASTIFRQAVIYAFCSTNLSWFLHSRQGSECLATSSRAAFFRVSYSD